MNLTWLAHTRYPRPPQRELRQRGVLDSGGRFFAHVANIHVDEDRSSAEVAERQGLRSAAGQRSEGCA